jgi:hypothetical protein
VGDPDAVELEHRFPLSHGTVLGRLDREGWLARAIDESLTPEEQAVLARSVELLERLSRASG